MDFETTTQHDGDTYAGTAQSRPAPHDFAFYSMVDAGLSSADEDVVLSDRVLHSDPPVAHEDSLLVTSLSASPLELQRSLGETDCCHVAETPMHLTDRMAVPCPVTLSDVLSHPDDDSSHDAMQVESETDVDKMQAFEHLSSLGLLDLTAQDLGNLPMPLASCGGLRTVLLSANKLKGAFAMPASWCATMRILDLSDNMLTCFPDLGQCFVLHTLLLMNNRLATLDAPGSALASLVEIRLRNNQLRGLSGLHRFPNLIRLDLACNCISGLLSLRPLSAWRQLRALALGGNGVASLLGLPVLLANMLPQLEACDVLAASADRSKHWLSTDKREVGDSPGHAATVVAKAGNAAAVLTKSARPCRSTGYSRRLHRKPMFFCTHSFRERVAELRASFSESAFLAALSGGGPPSAKFISEANPSGSGVASGSVQKASAEATRPSVIRWPTVQHSGAHGHRPVSADSVLSSREQAGYRRLAFSRYQRLPAEWSSALSDMSCSSLLERQSFLFG